VRDKEGKGNGEDGRGREEKEESKKEG